MMARDDCLVRGSKDEVFFFCLFFFILFYFIFIFSCSLYVDVLLEISNCGGRDWVMID